jgi:glycine betaine/proline transport system substrate-binding protein
MKKVLAVLTILLLSSVLLFTGCQGEDEAAKEPKDESSMMAEEKGEVDLVYVEWAREVAITHVAGEILSRMGYDVDITSVANAAMWASVASGDADAHLSAWLPSTHGMYYGPEGEYTDQVEDLGVTYNDAKLGLVVPAYVEYDSIQEAAENADAFDGKIIGIDPGAGMMQQTETAIEENISGMGAFELVEGSGATMAAALGNAIDNEEYIVVTGWAPHWKFGRWDLKILDDPEKVYGESETINNIGRLGLEEDMPEVHKFLSEFDWLSVDLGPVLVANQDGADPRESAKDFVDENLDLIKSAMPEGLSL